MPTKLRPSKNHRVIKNLSVFLDTFLTTRLAKLGFRYFKSRMGQQDFCTQLCGDKDQNLYEEMKLPNGMRVVLISNPTATMAAATLSVGAGSANDPTEHPGLAHLLEHMLFMGSDKYPEEDYYANFIASNGGVRNAYTALFETNYFHLLPVQHGKEALSILSRFFIDPQISENALEREKKAVDSEMKMNLPNNASRRIILMSNFIKKTHPMSKFNIGSEKTLAKTTRADLMSFWKYHYTPQNMTLVIFGKESLEELKGYATEFFSDVKAYKDAKWEFSGEPTHIEPATKRDRADKSYDIGTEETKNKIVYYRPYKEEKSNTQLTIHVFLPALRFAYQEQTLNFLIKMLENGSSEGLNAILLKNNIISSNTIFAQMERDLTHFIVHYTLVDATPEKIASLLNLIETYLNMIKDHATDNLYQKHANLMEKKKQRIAPSDQLTTTLQVATNLCYRQLKDIFTGDYDWVSFNKEDFDYILSIMTNRSNWLVMVETNDLFPETPLLSDPHFEVKYFLTDVSKTTDADIDALQTKLAWISTDTKEEIDFTTARNQNIAYPLGSSFKNIKEYVIPADKEFEHFAITEDGFEAHLIHKQDIHSKDVYLILCLGCNDIYQTINTFVSFSGYAVAFLNNFLLTHKEEMQTSGVSLDYIVEGSGAVSVSFSGNPLVLEDLITIFFQEFSTQKEELLTQTINAALAKYDAQKQTIPASKAILGLAKAKNYYKYLDDDACLQAAQNLTIQTFFSLTEADIKLYTIGNLTQSEFTRICQLIKTQIIPNPEKKFILTPPFLTHVNVSVQDQTNIALLVSHEVTQFTPIKNLIIADLISQALSTKFFDELRTKKSYGYIVQMASTPFFSQAQINWLVQTTYPYETIKTAVIEFIASISSTIQQLTPSQFSTIQHSLINLYQHKASNPQEYFNQRLNFWRFHHFSINYTDQLVQLTAAITQEDLVNYCANELSQNITTVLADHQVTTTP
ncbi:insulysin [Nematocida homosporus]|uniref:insulysin n=1 Tax=Nematocida homosporus TaxID=1912981 RepID=UPI002220B519|nr:insulysin [Nematocida homosporus]KAI5187096.1 insulysin [Nematocida homosporus]